VPTAATRTPLVATENPLRKQTLLGIAPTPPETPVARAENPLRKQTLLGVAPPEIGASAPASASEVPSTLDPVAPATTASDSVPMQPVASDAPTTLDLSRSEVQAPSAGSPPSTPLVVPLEPVTQAATATTSAAMPEDGEAEAKPRSRRGLWLAGAVAAAAAAIALLPRPDHPQSAEPTHKAAAKLEPSPVAAPAPERTPKGDDGDQPRAPDLPSEPDPLNRQPGARGAAPDAPATATAPDASATAPSGDVIRILVESEPRGARLFWKGKPVGTTPFTLEYQPGEKHAYEMGMPGFLTRKVVVDGSKPKVSVGLKPDPAAPTGAKRRK